MLQWIFATAISYAVGGKISAFVTDYIPGNLGIILSFLVMSMAIALAQWLVLRKRILGMGWLWATLVGGTLGGVFSSWASFWLAVTYGDAVDLLAVYACLRGLSIGFAQWMILKHSFRRSGWWVVGTTFSWYLSVMIGSQLMQILGYFLTLLVGAIYGLLTGSVLLLFFRQKFMSCQEG
ncbi:MULTISPECIES: hypothetical protein [Pseudanabaena]|uniref:Uncharacterized protein n=2 Tax=Pseudanabaena TaxID=1152 RepID=L8MVY7_9CYAN|nr:MULTISPECIES: hypothetical protein [Pseudanabaena]ELS32127.1 hypothetical protein Pse7429DRAFT_2639 [Pseudanabaena biceps PCC 7429]MDG3495646.1 hypothetical protein [Pseudanabaena catenata USMAC16]